MALAVPKLLAALLQNSDSPFNMHSGLKGGWRVTLEDQARRMTMLNGNVRPSTIEGVKSLATQIKKERGIKHAVALDLAAQAADCANFRHARRVLPSNNGPLVPDMVLLTVYWLDSKSHRCGRETIEVGLSKPILEIGGKSDFKRVRGFSWMRLVAPDHFVSDMLAQSQGHAREMACKAKRALRFMEYTGLRPALYHQTKYPDIKLPGADHGTDWVDPANGQHIVVDEPYGYPSLDDNNRKAWAVKHGWHIRKSSWPGMYFPHQCDLWVATDGSGDYDFETLMSKIDAIPAPATEEAWTGVSVPSLEVFVSPAAKTPQDRRRARSKGTVMPQSSASTIPYSPTLGNSERRPNGTMSIAEHIEAGRIIKAVINASNVRYGVYRRMNSLRSTLEDWLALEVGRDQLDGPEFFDVYYHGPDGTGPYAVAAQSGSGLIRILGELKQKLQAAYPDCAPLRKQLHRIDISASLIAKMRSEAR